MIGYETFCKIRRLADQKQLSAAQIAAELDVDFKTAEKWIPCASYQQRRPCKRPSKLDPFKGQIVAMLEGHAYTAQQILQRRLTSRYLRGERILLFRQPGKRFPVQYRALKKSSTKLWPG